MTWMNEYEIEDALRLFAREEKPNLRRGAETLSNLKEWTNSNSDGWPYWSKPAKAATRLMDELVQATSSIRTFHEVKDLTDAELRKALTPIKAFLTRQGVDHSEVIR